MNRLAKVTLVWNVLTILLGALVRATHSGAGCGRSWPTCDGQIVPGRAGATAIEYTHRVASGIALVLVIVLAVVVGRQTRRGDPARSAAGWATGAIIGEALIGAAIVFFEWVDADNSLARVIAVPLHLLNTFLLLAALTLVIWFAAGGSRLEQRGPSRRWITAAALGLLATAATGAVTALADTLFPKDGSGSLETTHFLSDLRVLHPLLAVGVVLVAALALRGSGLVRQWGPLAGLTLGQLLVGLANIWLGTPVWIQLVHLLIADLIWISYVWLSAQVLSRSEASSEVEGVGWRQTIPEHR
ncbi:hypothetical protein BH18ACT5_BH18ACT5_13290 [soil metagenome]